MIPSKKDLEIILSTIKGFQEPKPELEQYTTPSDISAELLWTAFMDGNIKDKVVADFGTGTGIFSFGAALLGAKFVYSYEIDLDALEIAKKNLKIIKKTQIPVCEIKFVKKEVEKVFKKADTVIMNPPFGVQVESADRPFLETAFKISNVVYSMHKADTDKFIRRFAEDHGFLAQNLGERELPLKATMEFHKKAKYPVKIAFWKFTKNI